MGGAQELFERIKYADADFKKKIALSVLAGVLFLAAGIFLIRALIGPDPETADPEIQEAATELRERLANDQPEPVDDPDAQPFVRGGQPAPN